MQVKTERNKEICEKAKRGYTVREIGKMYGISGAFVSFIVDREKRKALLKETWGSLSLRTITILSKHGINSLAQAKSTPTEELAKIQHINKVAIQEIMTATNE